MPDERPPPVSARRFVPLGLLVLAGGLFVALGGHRHLSFTALAANRDWLCGMVQRGGASAAITFVLAYAGLVALSFPAAELLTITAGFLFGRWLGTAYTVVGATIGATIVFLAARAGLAGLAARAGPWAERLEAGFQRNALNYLLVLRLVPLVPFCLVNLVAGAAGLRLRVYVIGTLIGIVPASFIYASLGTGLGALIAAGEQPDLSVVFEPGVLLPILALATLALLPVACRRWWRRAGEAAE